MNFIPTRSDKSHKRWLVLINAMFWLLLSGLISYAIAASGQGGDRSWISLYIQGFLGMGLFLVPAVYFNTQVLMPQFLLKKRYLYYIGSLILVSLIWPPFPIYLDNLIDSHYFGTAPEDLDEPFDITGTFVIMGVMIISTLINMTYRSFMQQGRVDQIEKEKLIMELSMLRNQISPHFFFNTLNNLYALALEESKETPGVILKLSEMMRYTLYDCDGDSVKIEDEIKYLQHYVDLQLIRHRHKVDIQFEHNVVERGLTICPLVLIVFLENAFKHGVEGLEEEGFIHMKLTASKEAFHFHIKNSVVPVRSLSFKNGIGLKNAQKRLELVYGEAYEFKTATGGDTFSVDLDINFAK